MYIPAGDHIIIKQVISLFLEKCLLSNKMKSNYIISLSKKDRIALNHIPEKGEHKAQLIIHMNFLLPVDANGLNQADREISDLYHCYPQTISTVRRRYLQYGFEEALKKKTRDSPSLPSILKRETKSVSLSYKQPPGGYSPWTRRLISDNFNAGNGQINFTKHYQENFRKHIET